MLHTLQFDRTVREQYIQYHPYPQNLERVTEVLQHIHPESVRIWQQMLEETTLQPGYLFITQWQYFEELCEWIYPVLEELETKIDVNQFEGYQSRVIAFLYERLVPVFLRTKGYKIEQRSVYFIDADSQETVSDYKWRYFEFLRLQMWRRIKSIIKKCLNYQNRHARV